MPFSIKSIRLRLDGFCRIYSVWLIAIFYSMPSWADFSLSIQQLRSKPLIVKGFSLTSRELSSDSMHLTAAFDELTLPELNFKTSQFSIDCAALLFAEQQSCQHADIKGISAQQQPYHARLNWLSKPGAFDINVSTLKPKGATLGLTLTQQQAHWQFKLHIQQLNATLLNQLMPTILEASSGTLTGVCQAQGDAGGLSTWNTQLQATDFSVQTRDGSYAIEKLTSELNFSAQHKQTNWNWQHHTRLQQGAVYANPWFFEVGKHPIRLTASGYWSDTTHQLLLSNSHYRHGTALSARASASLSLAPTWQIESLKLSLRSLDLSNFSNLYITPQLAETLDSLHLTGRVNASLTVKHNQLNHINAALNNVNFYIPKQDVEITGIYGHLAWDLSQKQLSSLRWQRIVLKRFPLDAASLKLVSVNRHIELTDAVQIPSLGGYIAVNRLHLNTDATQPTLAFSAELQQLKLNELASAFQWAPLSGTINGHIPNVYYHEDAITLDGDIAIDAFDGHIAISNLKAGHLFGNLPTVNADIAITQLDLNQLTQHFQFGSISGRLSGHIRQLILENWQPVSFFAWLGTPEHDDSEHKISQKAINSIAQIGGGATDRISRSILNVFDTFSYEQLGMGCYLHNGVCQLMGLEANGYGYTLIKGGGLPRVDVIGYNPRVDWTVLLNRLSRISSTSDVRIE